LGYHNRRDEAAVYSQATKLPEDKVLITFEQQHHATQREN
jgi:hypothetical protein